MDPHNLPLEDLRGDTASGCIVYNHPEKQHYLLFHGEKPPKEGYRQLREIWVAPIYKDLTVDLESAKKIVPQTNEHLSAPKLLIAPMTGTWSSRPDTGREGY
ncbi:hypothetical protein CW712_06830, partial [Candidatus Bathyarchaeota archaeon]